MNVTSLSNWPKPKSNWKKKWAYFISSTKKSEKEGKRKK
jgi:hypothetical protein